MVGGSTITTSTLSAGHPNVGIIISSSTALSTSTSILITNEYTSKIKTRYAKLRHWFNVKTLLHEKLILRSMTVKNMNQKEAEKKNFSSILG